MPAPSIARVTRMALVPLVGLAALAAGTALAAPAQAKANSTGDFAVTVNGTTYNLPIFPALAQAGRNA